MTRFSRADEIVFTKCTFVLSYEPEGDYLNSYPVFFYFILMQQLHQIEKVTSRGHNIVNIRSIRVLVFAFTSYWRILLSNVISCRESRSIVKIVKCDKKHYFSILNKLANRYILNAIFTVIIFLSDEISSKK